MGFCVPLQRHEKRRHWVWLLNIHLHFPLYGHNMLGLINFSQRWSSAHHLLGDNHICMPLRIIPLLLKLQSYSSQTWNFQTLLHGTDTSHPAPTVQCRTGTGTIACGDGWLEGFGKILFVCWHVFHYSPPPLSGIISSLLSIIFFPN